MPYGLDLMSDEIRKILLDTIPMALFIRDCRMSKEDDSDLVSFHILTRTAQKTI